MEMGLAQRQTLHIAMTQELQQAISILQYSAQELTSFLEMKAMENPLIQLESPMVKSNDTYDARIRSRKTNGSDSNQDKWLEQIADSSEHLADYLISQLIMEALPNGEKRLAKQLIYQLDKNGYLGVSLEEVAMINNVDIKAVQKCLAIIQGLDPAGVAARSLQECLLLQVKRRKDVPELVITLLEKDFNNFAERKWKEIAQKRSVRLTDIQAAADYIKTLHPRPGAAFTNERPQYIVPDLILQMDKDGLELQVCEHHIPKITYETDYYTRMKNYADERVNQFLGEKRQDYRWIMNSLEQRKLTLMKVGTAIVNIQKDFFLKGPRYLRPLTMSELAQMIDVHESTVSRAVRGKYIQTPKGTFELKIFFSQALQVSHHEDGEQASASQAKAMIEELVKKENKSKPLSDQRIVEQLQADGMALSRRTVAKYREQLGIPSSTKRKRYV
ncbi:RNA polymerase factor sigma-54 [Bacillus sp. FJAT-50079]|uniref:RNA polymerase factor sigma-54 n=1 Tax=Bacillus sp. FJAT-50079 TaxID=2833577 RepID=UPI002016291A|nr:RNA polymerase factor sigma-54 [Bacillus sp. FJAT-50079]